MGVAVISVAGLFGTGCAGGTTSRASSPTTTTVVGANQPAPFPGQLMQFATFDVGWLILPGGTSILHTTDGGARWQDTYRGPLQQKWIDAVGSRDAWSIVVSARNEPAGLMRTTDGGIRWTSLAERQDRVISAIDFASPVRGWAVTEGGHVLRTDDGGRSWRVVKLPVAAGTLCATASGQIWIGGANGDVYGSANSGVTWDLSMDYAQVPKLSAVFAPTITLIPWLTCSGSHAWALYDWGEAAGSSTYVVLATADDGASWAPVLANELGPTVRLPSISATVANMGTVPGGFAWFLGYCGACGTTGTADLVIEAGNSPPRTIPLTEVAPLTELDASFVDPAHGWVVGAEPSVFAYPPPRNGYPVSVIATTDGGTTWRRVGTISTT